jgi:ribonuclease HI
MGIIPFCKFFAEIVSPIPSYCNINNFFRTEFMNDNVGDVSNLEVNQIFAHLIDKLYDGYTTAYTDGSKITEPEPSTSAAIVFPAMNTIKRWKLPPDITVLGAELFALKQSLLYVRDNITYGDVVILTDSLSSIYILLSRTPKTYLFLAFQIQKLTFDLNVNRKVIIQFVPAHKDITGNESADAAAKAAHCDRLFTAPLSKEEMVRIVKNSVYCLWGQYYTNQVAITKKGLHLFNIKDQLSTWSWASNEIRVIETSLARLRSGHVGLNEHMYRFNMK